MGCRRSEVGAESLDSFSLDLITDAKPLDPSGRCGHRQERAEPLAEAELTAHHARARLRRLGAGSRMPLTRLVGLAEKQVQDRRAALHNLSIRRRSVLARISSTSTSERTITLTTLRKELLGDRSVARVRAVRSCWCLLHRSVGGRSDQDVSA
jgi:hypothetical protein